MYVKRIISGRGCSSRPQSAFRGGIFPLQATSWLICYKMVKDRSLETRRREGSSRNSRAGECPYCKSSAEIIKLYGAFDCLCCGKALKVQGIHELAIRLIAVAIGFLLARGAGFEGVLMFGFGLVISPFLVIPVWRVSAAVKRPVLIPASPSITTLSLDGGCTGPGKKSRKRKATPRCRRRFCKRCARKWPRCTELR